MTDRFFSRRFFTIAPVIFFGFILLTHFVLRLLRQQVFFDMDNYWPISIFLPKHPVWQDFIVLISLGIGWLVFLKLWQKGASLIHLIIITALLILSTNLLQGTYEGYIAPIAGVGPEDHQYWQDVDKIHGGLVNLLQNYELLQPTLHIHSRVHPPGPMMFLYILRSVWNNPIFVSIVILGLSLPTAYFIYDLLKTKLGEGYARFASLTLLLLPATQIYFVSTVDALIVMLFTATIWSWEKRQTTNWMLTTLFLLWLSSSFTFGVVFLIPILIFSDWRRHASIKKSLLLGAGLIGLDIFVATIFGYNYFSSFLLAKSFEGAKGFFGFEYPLSYLVTRLEDVFEVVLFFGPYLSFIFFTFITNWLKQKPLKSFSSISIVAVLSLLVFLLAGAYYTGETARAAMYIYPFLIISVAYAAKDLKLSFATQTTLLSLTFGQSVLMQLVGSYKW